MVGQTSVGDPFFENLFSSYDNAGKAPVSQEPVTQVTPQVSQTRQAAPTGADPAMASASQPTNQTAVSGQPSQPAEDAGAFFDNLFQQYDAPKSQKSTQTTTDDDNGNITVTAHKSQQQNAANQLMNSAPSDPDAYAVRNADGSITWHTPSQDHPAGVVGSAVFGGLSGIPFVGDALQRAAENTTGLAHDQSSNAYRLAQGASAGITTAAMLAPVAEAALASGVANGTGLAARTGNAILSGLADTSLGAQASNALGSAAANSVDTMQGLQDHPLLRTGAAIAAGAAAGAIPAFSSEAVNAAKSARLAISRQFGKEGTQSVSIPAVNGVNGVLSPAQTLTPRNSVMDAAAQSVQALPDSAKDAILRGTAPIIPAPGEHVMTTDVANANLAQPSAALSAAEKAVSQANPEAFSELRQNNDFARANALDSFVRNEAANAGSNADTAIGAMQSGRIADAQASGDAALNTAIANQRQATDAMTGYGDKQSFGEAIRNATGAERDARIAQAGSVLNAIHGDNADAKIPMSHVIATAKSLANPVVAEGAIPDRINPSVRSFLMNVANKLGPNTSLADTQRLLSQISDMRNGLAPISRNGATSTTDMVTRADIGRLTELQNAVYEAIGGKVDSSVANYMRQSAIGKEAQQVGLKNIADGTVGTPNAARVPDSIKQEIYARVAQSPGLGEDVAQSLAAGRTNYAKTLAQYRDNTTARRLLSVSQPPSGLADYLFGGGAGSLSRFNDYKELVPADTAITHATAAMFQRLRDTGAIDSTGQINRAAFENNNSAGSRILKQMQDMGLHDAAGKVTGAVNAQHAIDDLAASNVENVRNLQDSVAARFIGQSPQAALEGVLGRSANGVSAVQRQSMNDLISQVRSDPDALASLRYHTAQWLANNVMAPDGTINRSAYLRIMSQLGGDNGPRDRSPITQLFGGQGRQALDQLVAGLARSQRVSRGLGSSKQITTPDVSGSPDTIGSIALFDTVKSLLHHESASLIGNAATNGAAWLGARALTTLHKQTIGRLTSAVRQQNINDAQDLMTFAFVHPEVMRVLLTHVPANQPPPPMLVKRLQGAMVRSAANNSIVLFNRRNRSK